MKLQDKLGLTKDMTDEEKHLFWMICDEHVEQLWDLACLDYGVKGNMASKVLEKLGEFEK